MTLIDPNTNRPYEAPKTQEEIMQDYLAATDESVGDVLKALRSFISGIPPESEDQFMYDLVTARAVEIQHLLSWGPETEESDGQHWALCVFLAQICFWAAANTIGGHKNFNELRAFIQSVTVVPPTPPGGRA